MASNCKIHVNTFQYQSGGVIAGRVQCNFNSSKSVREIRIELLGEERTSWTDTESYYDSVEKKQKTRYVQLSGHHVIVSNRQTLYGGGGSTLNINAGSYSYEFDLRLSPSLPSNYSGHYGQITYQLKAVVDRPMQFDIEDVVNLDIFSPINFNEMSSSLLAFHERENEKYTCCWCCSSGPITMNLSVNRLAFVLGQPVQVKIYITNMSNTNVNEITLKLKQTIKAIVTTPRHDSKYDTSLLSSIVKSGVGAHGENTHEIQLEIPANLVIPNFQNSSLYSVSYSLQASASLDGCHSDLDVEIKPTLGHFLNQAGPAMAIVTPPTMMPSLPYSNPPQGQYPAAIGFVNPCQGTMPMPADQFSGSNDDDDWVNVDDNGKTIHPTSKPGAVRGGPPTAPALDPCLVPSAPPPTYEQSMAYEQKM